VGFLESDPAATPFLEKRGYRRQRAVFVFQRSLDRAFAVSDARFPAHRNRYEIHAGPYHGATWWQESVLGPIELHEYRLAEKSTGKVVARATVWEMETYRSRWNEHAIGITDLQVIPELRRQGLAKFLLAQALRHLQEQFFTLIEMQVPADNPAALGLVKGMGFAQVDVGHLYRHESPAPT
jgi:ribosomal protein S18 acetylase RimI-like enzyme